jgi:hypothetical protein
LTGGTGRVLRRERHGWDKAGDRDSVLPEEVRDVTRVAKRQTQPTSCGAAALVVALYELGRSPAFTNDEELAIYNDIKFAGFGDNKLGENGTLPSGICDYAKKQGVTAQVIESPDTVRMLNFTEFKAAADLRQLYEQRPTMLGPDPVDRDVQDSDFDGDARIFFLVLGGMGVLHWLLGRKESKQIYIMDPADGSDKSGALVKAGANLTTTAGTYLFTGIAVRVWK